MITGKIHSPLALTTIPINYINLAYLCHQLFLSSLRVKIGFIKQDNLRFNMSFQSIYIWLNINTKRFSPCKTEIASCFQDLVIICLWKSEWNSLLLLKVGLKINIICWKYHLLFVLKKMLKNVERFSSSLMTLVEARVIE